MPDGGGASSARIGPNAVWQLLPVLKEAGGAALRDGCLALARCGDFAGAEGLVPEEPVARLHRAVRMARPGDAAAILREAGLRTGDYILAHRIPRLAQRALRLSPVRLAAPVLARAIAKHAWTFAGSGQFRVISTAPLVFELRGNPLIRGESSDHALCAWHEGVFERLFRALVHPGARASETACAAAGAPACRFEIRV